MVQVETMPETHPTDWQIGLTTLKGESMTQGALQGITVLDLSRVLAGPYATMTLGDLGARVIKVEQPDRGDDTRHWGPPFSPNGESAYFFCANRNKESITVNLKHESGRRLIREMVKHCDVLVENFRVGTLDRLELGYSWLCEINPGLIFCSISGYGQTGPKRTTRAEDRFAVDQRIPPGLS